MVVRIRLVLELVLDCVDVVEGMGDIEWLSRHRDIPDVLDVNVTNEVQTSI